MLVANVCVFGGLLVILVEVGVKTKRAADTLITFACACESDTAFGAVAVIHGGSYLVLGSR